MHKLCIKITSFNLVLTIFLIFGCVKFLELLEKANFRKKYNEIRTENFIG